MIKLSVSLNIFEFSLVSSFLFKLFKIIKFFCVRESGESYMNGKISNSMNDPNNGKTMEKAAGSKFPTLKLFRAIPSKYSISSPKFTLNSLDTVSILIKCAKYFQVIVSHSYMIVYDIKIMSTFRKNLISGSFPEYGNFKILFPLLAYTTKRCGIKF